MRMYLSGSFGNANDVLVPYMLENNSYRLCTYAYPKEVFDYLDYAESMGLRANLLIDSGAFSAWNIGKPVQLEKLLAYNKALLDRYGDKHEFMFISLDVIPGERGRKPTEAELKQGIKASCDNFLVMQQELNAPVLPVYHSGAPLRLRDWYVARSEYLCLSMNQEMSERDRVGWAMRVQVPGVKMHGLAATGNTMIRYIDWFSVDSAGWVMVGAMGSILWPTEDGLRPIAVSTNSPSRKGFNKHITTLTMSEQMEAYIEAQGFTVEALATDYAQRWKWNLTQWTHMDWKRTPFITEGLFSD